MKNNIIICLLLSGLLVSCESFRLQDYSVSGKVQKGPFITGTSVTLNELDNNLVQTGRSFTSSILSDDGRFDLGNIELGSNLALLTATGYYFSEIYGALSNAPLTLQAITDLNDKKSVNINILTHLVKGRVEKLVGEGMTFNEASAQAKSEMLTFLGVSEPFDTDFESLDISQSNDYNAVLLAISLMVQRFTFHPDDRPASTAELTELLAKLSLDFKGNGKIDNQDLINALLFNISQLNLRDISYNIGRRYADLGLQFFIPDFKTYIGKFQAKYKPFLYTDIYYPKSAPDDVEWSPDYLYPNILVKEDTVFQFGLNSIAAIIPHDAELTIRIVLQEGNFTTGGENSIQGWQYYSYSSPPKLEMFAQRWNELMSAAIYLNEPGSATIEYFENDMDTPAFIKTITWNY